MLGKIGCLYICEKNIADLKKNCPKNCRGKLNKIIAPLAPKKSLSVLPQNKISLHLIYKEKRLCFCLKEKKFAYEEKTYPHLGIKSSAPYRPCHGTASLLLTLCYLDVYHCERYVNWMFFTVNVLLFGCFLL